jgi:hypothetical protein
MKMKKFLGLLIVFFFVVTMMPGGAWASELDIALADSNAVDFPDVDATPSGPYVVGSEWLAGQSGGVDVDLGNAIQVPGSLQGVDRSDIYYEPSINIALGNTIRITVTNGAIETNTNYGLWASAGAITGRVARLTDFESGPLGYISMLFQFDFEIDADTVLTLVPDGTLPPSSTNRPTLIFTHDQLTAGEMRLQVTDARDTNGQPLTAPRTGPETVAKRAAQLSAKVQFPTSISTPTYSDGPATSVVDVEADPSRAKFVVEVDGDTPTDIQSIAAVLVEDAIVNDGIFVAASSYILTLNDHQDAIENVQIGSPVEDFTKVGDSWVLDTTMVNHPLIFPGFNNIVITVSGTQVINIQELTIDLVIDPAETEVNSQQSLSNETAFRWSINAMQAKIPYLALNFTGFNSFIKVAVEGSNASDLSADAIIWNVTDNVTTTQQAVFIRNLPGPSLETIGEADLMTAFGLDTSKSYHIELTLTVVAPQNTVQVSAFQKDTVGRTAIPVLYNTNNTADGRSWQ